MENAPYGASPIFAAAAAHFIRSEVLVSRQPSLSGVQMDKIPCDLWSILDEGRMLYFVLLVNRVSSGMSVVRTAAVLAVCILCHS